MSYRVKLESDGRVFEVFDSETLLDALIREGVDYPHGCTSGVCGLCKSRLVAGSVDLADYYPSILPDEEREAGLILVCRAVPLSDCAIVPVQPDVILPPTRSLTARIDRLESLTHDIKLVQLTTESGEPLHFLAGQYASLSLDGTDGRDFSMANAPGGSTLEFFIRRVPGGAFTEFLFERAAIGQRLTLRGPFGLAFLREGHIGPILAVAGGSGLAPVRSIVTTALRRGMKQPMRVYVGVREERDVYGERDFSVLQSAHPNLSVRFALSSQGAGAAGRRKGLVHDVLADDLQGECLEETRAYVAGPPAMVEAVSEVLARLGLPPARCHVDPFLTVADKMERARTGQGDS